MNAAEQLREQAEESVLEVSEAEVGATMSTGAIRIAGTASASPSSPSAPSTCSVTTVLERDGRESRG